MSDPAFRYDVEYGEGFRDQVTLGDINPLCGLRIVVNGEDLAGAPPGESHIDEYLFYHFRKVVSSIPDVLDGERKELQLYNVSDYLVLSPTDGTVAVSLQSPREREDADREMPAGTEVSKGDLVTGVTDGVEGFHANLVDVNPALSGNEDLSELLDAVDSLRETE